MNKHYLYRELNQLTVGGSGYVMINLFHADPLLTQIYSLSQENELIGVHKAKIVVKVSQESDFYLDFAAVLLAFLGDGTVASSNPGAALNGQIHELFMDFQQTEQFGMKFLDFKTSAPVKASESAAVYAHQAVFIIDAKDFVKECAKLNADPITSGQKVGGYAVAVHSANTIVVHTSCALYLEYSVHDRPMRTFARKTL
jgi:hypothetical protein